MVSKLSCSGRLNVLISRKGTVGSYKCKILNLGILLF
jgi:hypothetical protein